MGCSFFFKHFCGLFCCWSFFSKVQVFLSQFKYFSVLFCLFDFVVFVCLLISFPYLHTPPTLYPLSLKTSHTPGRKGGVFSLPLGAKIIVPEVLFGKKDTISCSVASPDSRWQTCPAHLPSYEHVKQVGTIGCTQSFLNLFFNYI